MAGEKMTLVALAAGVAGGLALALNAAAAEADAVSIGHRRELFVDKFLIASLDRTELRLHAPSRREIVLVRDAPWEGSGSNYERLIRDDRLIRLYYGGNQETNHDGTVFGSYRCYECYAESLD